MITRRLISVLGLMTLSLAFAIPASASSAGQKLGAAGSDQEWGVISGTSVRNDISVPLRTIRPIQTAPRPPVPRADKPTVKVNGHSNQTDSVVQHWFRPPHRTLPTTQRETAPTTLAGWDGMNFTTGGCNCAPPDTNGQVGPNNYVQIVNTSFQVFDKSGTSLYGPANINTIWSGFGGSCAIHNDGDPVLLYDQLADRWLISQFTAESPYTECIAVSQTGDPTGKWNRYAFQLSTTDFPDYPKISVWPDGYYMTVNWFSGGYSYNGPRPYVFNRSQMLAGAPATYQSTATALGSSVNPILPADLDGATPPPSGAPDYFISDSNTLDLYKFHVNWSNRASSYFRSYAHLGIAGWTQLCPDPTTNACVPQPGTSNQLDTLGDRMMFRLAYRNFGDHESMVVNRSVDVGGGQSGVRWYEVRNPGTTPTLYQQGTYAPDSASRWMASAAMDHNGDLAIGYSVSSSSLYPSIRYTGRLAGDPLGTLPQGEFSLQEGTGSQTSPDRWGDYSSLTVDPTDDCTFWYTQEYYKSVTSWDWQTHIGSFKFPGCGSSPIHLAVSTPSSATAGSPFDVTVTAEDASNNPVTGYTGTVHFTSSDGKAALPADYTFTATDNGSHTFASGVTLKTAGNQTVTGTDTSSSSVTGQSSVAVSPAPAASFSFVNTPSTAATGTPFNYTVKAMDPYSNVATGYTGTVHFTSTDTAATLPQDYPYTAGDAGSHTFSATLNSTGSFTISATDSANSINGQSGSIAAAQVVVQKPSAPAVVLAVPGNGQASLIWDAPGSNGGGTIQSYTVSCAPACTPVTTPDGSTTRATVTGLNNGTSYTFTVVATNSAGSGAGTSTSVTPTSLSAAYSDPLSFGVSAHDAAGTGVPVSESGALPAGVSFSGGSTGNATVSGTVSSGSGSFPVSFTANNGSAPAVTQGATIAVTQDDAIVQIPINSRHMIRVLSAGGSAGSFALSATLQDTADGHPGNIANAQPVTFGLIPVGSTSAAYTCTASSGTVSSGTLTENCTFPSGVARDVYDVHVSVGGSYFSGYADSVLTIFDPSLGGSSGGAAITGPNGFPAVFGFLARNVGGVTQGKVLYLECGDSACTTSKVTTLSSSNLSAMAISSTGVTARTATVSGSGSLNGVSGYSFTITAYDADARAYTSLPDQYGMQVTDPSSASVPGLVFNPVNISYGNIVEAAS